MTKNEFAKACSAGGYCSKAIAEKYAKATGKTEFSEKDFEEVFRFAAKMQTEYWEMPHHATTNSAVEPAGLPVG